MVASKPTFTMREAPVGASTDRAGLSELLLSKEWSRMPTKTMELANDAHLAYSIKIEDTVPASTTEELGSSLSLASAIEVVASGVEGAVDGATTMSARSSILLRRFCSVLDRYLAAHPDRLCIADESLKLPNATNRIVVGPDKSEEAFNSEYCDRTLFLVQCLLQLGQDAYRWQEEKAMQIGLELNGKFKALLPTAREKTMKFSAACQFQNSHLQNSGDRLGPATSVAYADFYVSCGDEVIATLESKPQCNARAVGILARERNDSLRLSERGATKLDSWDTELLLRIASQSAVTGLKMGMLVADWGRVLLPYEVIRETSRQESLTEARIVFSSTPCYNDIFGGAKALDDAKRDVSAGFQDQTPGLELTSLPNAVFYLLAWVLRVVEETDIETGIAEEDGKAGALDGPSDREAGPSSKRGPPDGDRYEESTARSRRSHASGSAPVATLAGQKISGSSTGKGDKGKGKSMGEAKCKGKGKGKGMSEGEAKAIVKTESKGTNQGEGKAMVKAMGEGENKGSWTRHDYDALVRCFRLVTTYISSYTPVNDDTFATVHLCLLHKAHLEDDNGGEHELDHQGGQSCFRVLRYPSSDEVEALLKVQRIPLVDQEPGDRSNWRLERDDDPPMEEQDRLDIQQRTMRELRVFLRCQDLQGSTIPKLYGVVSPRNYPLSTAHKLMVQSLAGGPIANLHSKFFLVWRKELVSGAMHAISSLHSRSVWHGDLSNSNIRVEWRRYSSPAEHSSIYKTIQPLAVLAAVEKAQHSMQISDKDLEAAADKLSTAADAENSAIVLNSTSSPLEDLKTTILPHIWLIDFAESKPRGGPSAPLCRITEDERHSVKRGVRESVRIWELGRLLEACGEVLEVPLYLVRQDRVSWPKFDRSEGMTCVLPLADSIAVTRNQALA